MTNIINFPEQNDDLKKVSYTDKDGDLGISTRCSQLEIVRLNDTDFEVRLGNNSLVFDRETLAEFFWVSATFVDSEKKWLPELDLIGCDY